MLRGHEWSVVIGDYLTFLTASGAPSTTRDTRRHHLNRVANGVGGTPWSLSEDRLLVWFSGQDWAIETRRSIRTTLRSFYRWGVETGRTFTDVAACLPVAKASRPNPRPVPEPIYRAAVLAAEPRERLMLRLAGEMGLRRAEVATVHSRNLEEDLAGWSLRVLGKGNRERVIPLPPALAAELRSLAPGWAFPGNDNGHLSPRWVGTIIGRLLPGSWTMHKLRHRFASVAYSIDRDVFAVQDLLGHASPATTRCYVAIPNDSLRRTIEAVAA